MLYGIASQSSQYGDQDLMLFETIYLMYPRSRIWCTSLDNTRKFWNYSNVWRGLFGLGGTRKG